MKASSFDVVIIGAGIAGIATAYYLATQQGITNILLVDKRPPMTYTSDKSGSNYRNWWSHPSMMQLANHSIDLMDTLAQSNGNFFNLNRRGYAYFSQDKDLLSYLESYSHPELGEIRIHDSDLKMYQPQENPDLVGADVILGHEQVKNVAPFVSDSIQSMVHVRRAGWVSTRVMAHHMLDTATQLGLLEMRGEVKHIDHSEVKSTLTIQTASGEQVVQTSKLVLTVGPYLPQFGKLLGLDFPVDNVMHKKVMVCDDGYVIPDEMPFMIFRDAPTLEWTDEEYAYLKSHVGGGRIPGNFHIRRVNPKWIHVGWAFNRQLATNLNEIHVDEMFPKIVLKGISSFIPALRSYGEAMPQPIVVSGGYYTRTRENLPIIEETECSGIYVIGALSGFGVMMGCGAGELLSRMIVEQAVPSYVQDFSLSRYNILDYEQTLHQYGSGEL